jgi:fluoride exporter
MSASGGDHSSRPAYLRPTYLCTVWLGGAGGTAARYLLSSKVADGTQLPLATLLINLAGAFLLGVLLERLGRARGEPERRRLVRLLAGTGFLGAFTTYSALANDAVRLWQAGLVAQAVGYALGTVLLGAVASLAGIVAGARLRRSKSR